MRPTRVEAGGGGPDWLAECGGSGVGWLGSAGAEAATGGALMSSAGLSVSILWAVVVVVGEDEMLLMAWFGFVVSELLRALSTRLASSTDRL